MAPWLRVLDGAAQRKANLRSKPSFVGLVETTRERNAYETLLDLKLRFTMHD
jgi:hypothetical protein